MSSALETALARYRAWSLAALSLLVILAWIWLINGAGMGMSSFVSLLPPPNDETAMPGMMMTHAGMWSVGRFALTFSMWWTMMVAMMLPSAAPTIMLYVRAATHGNAKIRPATASFLAGYLIAWGGFSLLATSLQAVFDHVGMISTMHLASQSQWLSATILMIAGVYQISPIKDVCLRHCRNPAQFLSRHYRSGRAGAMQMGMFHGTYCVGCCWLLMALLFVGGIMNLAWIALLTLMVAAEKLLPSGRLVARATGWACMAWGATLLLG